MIRLPISADLALPASVTTEKLAFLGRTGSGKTYAAMKLAELLHAADAQFVALDPVGVWWGLRLAANGKDAGIPIPVLGGLHGDVPLEPTGGKLVADIVVDRGISVVIDVSQFESDADKARFASDFAARFFYRKKAAPSAVHVFIEEAQEFVPQNIQRGEEKMLHNWQRLVRLGRNFGIGASLITQRPQDVNKKALNMAEILFAFQTTGPQERKAIDIWMADKGLDQDIAADLPKLSVGVAHAWSPALLRISKTVRIAEKETFNASSTPTVGHRSRARALAPIDMTALGEAMKASVEKAAAEDPRRLQARIRELEAELKRARPADPNAVGDAVAAALREERRRTAAVIESIGKRIDRVADLTGAVTEATRAACAALQIPFEERQTIMASRETRPPAPARPRERRPASDAGSSLRKGEREMLSTLASRHPGTLTAAQLGTLSGFTPSGGTFRTYLGTLRRLELIEGGVKDLRISATGFDALGLSEPPPPASREDILDRWRASFRAGERSMLDALVRAHPKSLSRDDLGEATGFTATGGTFRTYLGTLSRNGLIESRDGVVRLVDHLGEVI